MVRTRRGAVSGRMEKQVKRLNQYKRNKAASRIQDFMRRYARRNVRNNSMDNSYDFNDNIVETTNMNTSELINRLLNEPLPGENTQESQPYRPSDQCHRHRKPDNQPKTQRVEGYHRRRPINR